MVKSNIEDVQQSHETHTTKRRENEMNVISQKEQDMQQKLAKAIFYEPLQVISSNDFDAEEEVA